MILLVLLISLTFKTTPILGNNEPKFQVNSNHSLIYPFYVTNNWLLRGTSYIDVDKITLVTPKQDQLGSIWNKIPITANAWKVELDYTTINGPSNEVADGIALWYLPLSTQWNFEAQHRTNGGPNADFVGLMVLVDTYYNPSWVSLQRNKTDSAIIAAYNEVPRFYNGDTEGYEIMLGRCLARNQQRQPGVVEKLTVEYVQERLTVFHTKTDVNPCVNVSLKLPTGYILGVSAATGAIIGTFQIRSLKFFEDLSPSVKQIERMGVDEPQKSTLFLIVYALGGFLILFLIIIFIMAYFLKKHHTSRRDYKTDVSVPDSALHLSKVSYNRPVFASTAKASGDRTSDYYYENTEDDYDHIHYPK